MKKNCVYLVFLILLFTSCNKDDIPIITGYSNLTVGVFGGSISSRPESKVAKNMWIKHFGFNVLTHGRGGAGFSAVAPLQISKQISEAPVYDVYILWASTNDVAYGAEAGDLYTTDLSTQNGGIRECISLIKSKNKNAQILFFVSLYRFNKVYESLPIFIESQIALCKELDIPYLDQSGYYNEDNYKDFYLPDRIHLNESGYAIIAPAQIEFFFKNLKMKP